MAVFPKRPRTKRQKRENYDRNWAKGKWDGGKLDAPKPEVPFTIRMTEIGGQMVEVKVYQSRIEQTEPQ